MPVWATVVLTLGSSLIAASAAILAAERQGRHATKEREAISRAQQLESAAQVLGRVLTLGADLDPGEIAANINNSSVGVLQQVGGRWLSLRDELAVLAALRGGRFAELVGRLVFAINATYGRLVPLIESKQVGARPLADESEVLEAAYEHHREAARVTAELLAMIQTPEA